MHIEKLKIQNIKSIKEFELPFDNPAGWHVIIGDNGAGKSSILKAIALAIIGPSDALSLRVNWNGYVNFESEEANIELTIKRHDIDAFEGASRPLKKPFNAGVKITRINGSRQLAGKIEMLKRYNYAKNYVWSNRVGWFSASFGPFRRFTGGNKEWEKVYYSNPRAASHLSVFGEDVALTESLEWLVNLNYKKLEGDDESIDLLHCFTKFINEGNLLPHNAKISEITSDGVFIIDGNDKKVSVTEMSDGFRSILSMTFEIIRQLVLNFGNDKVFQSVKNGEIEIPIEGIVLIDEVDAHLHPTWQTEIGKWFTKYFPNMQFIVTTHSPLICRAADNGCIWRLASPGSTEPYEKVEGIERDRLISGNILDAYGTELFGKSPVRSEESNEKLKKLGELNILFALGQISQEEEEERQELQKILSTDDPTGY